MKEDTPDRELLKIADLMRETGLSRQVIYEYITFGIIKEAKKTEGGHRLFIPEAVSLLKLARELNESGYSLRAIRETFIRGEARKELDEEDER